MLVDDLKDTIEERVVTSTSTATATAIVGRRTRRRRKAKQSMPPAISAEKQQILFQSMMMSSCSSQSFNTEPLWLAPEELFYLTWQTGSLHVIDQITKECLDPWQLWLRCCQAYRPRNINTEFSTMSNNSSDDDDNDNVANHTFVARYAVYRYLREKDWIVRDGIKYGADYVIYKKGPIFDHSVAAILVCPVVVYNSSNVHKDSYDNVLVNYNRRVSLDWINLLGLLRVCNQVRKVLHICFVYIPMMGDDDDTWRYQEPMDIQSYRIEEVIIKRWVPERNRS
ncbi:tRNA intron endonuclease [Syncephalis plumigaleata]|nr:tRNA intron endonuclease [Syncephalis plumigaleata]